MGLPLYMTCLLSFATFSILSLFCMLSVLIMMYLGCFFFSPDRLVSCKLSAPRYSSLLKIREVFSFYVIE
jgi:hypothetical protein